MDKGKKIEKKKAERMLGDEPNIAFFGDDLSIAIIPGGDIDPNRHRLSKEDLMPRPIVRKRRKV